MTTFKTTQEGKKRTAGNSAMGVMEVGYTLVLSHVSHFGMTAEKLHVHMDDGSLVILVGKDVKAFVKAMEGND